MKVTVCLLRTQPEPFLEDWAGLVKHVQSEKSDLVLLPEMPFYHWVYSEPKFDPAMWTEAVAAHDQWMERLGELGAKTVLGSRPITIDDKRFNAGFVWTAEAGVRLVHNKVYLPNEDGFWEATWYDRGEDNFTPVDVGDLQIGFAICTELWFMGKAQEYGEQGIHLLVTPRSTEYATREKWLAGGRTAAIVSGAFGLSSSHNGIVGDMRFGGLSWIIDPDGKVLGTASDDEPYLTHDIDIEQAVKAKSNYPRDVLR